MRDGRSMIGGRLTARAWTAMAAAAIVACGASTSPSGGPDAANDGPTRLPDGGFVEGGPAASSDAGCCPIDPQPSGCMQLGGSSSCGETCDFWCSTNWRVEKDAKGCPEWRYDHLDGCTPGAPPPGMDAASE